MDTDRIAEAAAEAEANDELDNFTEPDPDGDYMESDFGRYGYDDADRYFGDW
jgi:hypothetical protein